MNQDSRDKLADLQMRNAVRNSVDSGALSKFQVDDIPLKKFYEQAEYIEHVMLPKVETARGKNSADYKFFVEVYRSLVYAVMIVDRGDRLIRQCQHLRQFNTFLQERADLAERELSKYTAMEDLLLTDGMDKIAAAVKQRIEDTFK